MLKLKRVVLDVLKPHQPDAVAFCRELAELGPTYRVSLDVQEMAPEFDFKHGNIRQYIAERSDD